MKRLITSKDSRADLLAQEYVDPGFSADVIQWQKQHGRHALPWQQTTDAYQVWLSEIMLQQTQVSAVIPYYQRFLQSFPTVFALAAAPSEQVMGHWSGLGYYTRARNLHACAKRIVEQYDGRFPADPILLEQLPGIGRSTAAAISAFSYGTIAAILDGNVKRVFARVFGIHGYPGAKPVEDAMWLRARALLPENEIASYTQGLMDLGATLCTRSSPACQRCPLLMRCVASAQKLTAELPAKKPKKKAKEKYATMLVLLHEDQVLLEQRPDSGIWGGLLSLPEVDGMRERPVASAPADADADAEIMQLVQRFGEFSTLDSLPEFTHVFTHFKLHITPVLVHLSQRSNMIAEARYAWFDMSKLMLAPLPAPVKSLLLSLVVQI
ncbi:MAG: A/G-specific adenine glycosylase [Pseudomonadota bacterium]